MMDSESSISCYTQSLIDNENPAFLLYKEFLKQHHVPDLIRILLQTETGVHYSILSDCSSLLKTNVDFAEELFCQSEDVFKSFGHALRVLSKEIYTSHSLKHQMKLKHGLHARLNKFPRCEELWRQRVPKSKDIGKLLAVEGTVIRTSSVKLLEYQKELMCTKCKSVFTIKSEFTQNYRIVTPTKCPAGFNCNSKKFMIVSSGGSSSLNKCKDFQEIRIQEQIRRLAMGTIPRTITVVLEDDLVDSCKAGDDVVVFGTLLCRWRPSQVGKPCELEIVIKANYIEVRNEQQLGETVKEEMQSDFDCFWVSYMDKPMSARNHILSSLCPQIYGLYVVKLAVALILAGGVAKTDSTGSRVRGEAHLLMVGDPGTGKSQFLKYATKITPRSVLTTGIGSTTAGLTVTAVRDGPHWTLEAGALVLADGGLCCIDEFSSIKEHDRCAIHEAMEQQTVSVAKAGLVCKLNTRTSILAATNPKLGKYDESSDLSMNLAIGSPLLSRFDVILVLLDSKNEKWDSVVADYLLMGKDVVQELRGSTSKKPKLWTLEQMQAYFCLIRQLKPVLTPKADKILSEYYRCHRRSNVRNAARTTIRLLESLIRLAEAHARLMYRETVEVQDAIAAITIMESSMHGSSLLPTGSVLHSCFPSDAEKEYQKHEKLVLQCLGLQEISNNNTPNNCTPLSNSDLGQKNNQENSNNDKLQTGATGVKQENLNASLNSDNLFPSWEMTQGLNQVLDKTSLNNANTNTFFKRKESNSGNNEFKNKSNNHLDFIKDNTSISTASTSPSSSNKLPKSVNTNSLNLRDKNSFKKVVEKSTKTSPKLRNIFKLPEEEEFDFDVDLDFNAMKDFNLKPNQHLNKINAPIITQEKFSKSMCENNMKTELKNDISNKTNNNEKKLVTSTQKLNDIPSTSKSYVSCLTEFSVEPDFEISGDDWFNHTMDRERDKRVVNDDYISYSPKSNAVSPQSEKFADFVSYSSDMSKSQMQKEFENNENATLNPSLIENICNDLQKENKKNKQKDIPQRKSSKNGFSLFKINSNTDENEIYFPSQLSCISMGKDKLYQASQKVTSSLKETQNIISSKENDMKQNVGTKSKITSSKLFQIDNSEFDLDVSLDLSNFDTDWSSETLPKKFRKSFEFK